MKGKRETGGKMKIAKAATISIILLLGLGIIGTVSAANPHTTDNPTGQPNQTCGDCLAPNGPGNAPSAPGSAFNENGGVAGGVYAGNNQNAPGFANGKANGNAVSQYDVGCYQVSQQSYGHTTLEPTVPC